MTTRYSPDNWDQAAAKPMLMVRTKSCPTLGQLNDIYGAGAAAEWMMLQVRALFAWGSDRDAERGKSLLLFAKSFWTDCRTLKLTELMLFFNGYRSGKYGTSYATSEPRVVGMAFRKDFLPVLQRLRERVMEEEQQKKRERGPRNCITLYQHRHATHLPYEITVENEEAFRAAASVSLTPIVPASPTSYPVDVKIDVPCDKLHVLYDLRKRGLADLS